MWTLDLHLDAKDGWLLAASQRWWLTLIKCGSSGIGRDCSYTSRMTKADLHDLVDRLPEGAVDGAAILLRGDHGWADRPRAGLVLDPRVAGERAGGRRGPRR